VADPASSRVRIDRDRPTLGRSGRSFVLVLLGILCLQASWALAVPPFRGLDEHDHAYKAAATARGDVATSHEVSDQGWGYFMDVPRDVVEAATPICDSLPYTTDDNCRPGQETSPGQVRVASAMANINPAFYFVVGTAARPFDGVAALYAMRAASALMCALALSVAFVATRRSARGPLLPTALVLALTPVVMYSASIAAPNGLEISSGVLVWAALLRAVSVDVDTGESDAWVRVAAVGASLLVTLRSMGALWLLLIVATVVVWAGWKRVAPMVRRRNTRMSAGVVTGFAFLAAAWIVAARPNKIDSVVGHFDNPLWVVLPQQWVLWFFQSVAAIPARDDLVPMSAYALAFAAWGAIVAPALKVAERRDRRALLMVFGLSSLVPLAATAWFYSSLGTAWQGRYTLPFSIGFLMLCGHVLDRRLHLGVATARRLALGLVLVATVVAVISQVHVLRAQLQTSPLSGTSAWPAPSVWQSIALTLAGMAMLGLGAVGHAARVRDDADPGPDGSSTQPPTSRVET
jgi:hypothetical protein